MADNRTLGIFSMGLCGVLLLASVYLYNSNQGEKRARLQKEMEVSNMTADLAQKEASINDLAKQKEDLKNELSTKISSLEKSASDSQLQVQSLTQNVSTLSHDNEILKKDAEDKPRKISSLMRSLEDARNEKKDLLAKVSSLQTQHQYAEAADEPIEVPNVETEIPEDFASLDLGVLVEKKSRGVPSRVQHTDPMFGFIVFNAGSDDDIKVGTLVNIIRGRQLVAKAIVRQVQLQTSGAMLLPEWKETVIKRGDLISQYVLQEKKILTNFHPNTPGQ